MVAAFPVFKLGALVLKQASKPLANLAKARAKQSPFFRNYICMPPAQFYHWCEVKLKMWTMNLGKPVNIPKLNESAAIELGAELVGEGLIFTIASGILIFEFVRQSRKEAAKEAERLSQMEQIQADLRELYSQNIEQRFHIRELVRILNAKMPDASFNPDQLSDYDMPAHHRPHAPEEEVSTYTTVKGWIFNAIDYVLPAGDNAVETQPKIIIVQQTKPSVEENCKCEDKGPSTTVNKETPNR